MGIFTYDPGLLASFDLNDPKQLRVWQAQISQSLVQIENIVSSLSTSPTYMSNLVLATPVDLGTITTNKTIPVNGKTAIFARFTSSVTQTLTITFTGLTQGATLFLEGNVGPTSTLTLLLAATDPAGNTYAITAFNLVTRGFIDMVATGFAATGSASWFAFGMSGFLAVRTAPQLDLLLAN